MWPKGTDISAQGNALVVLHKSRMICQTLSCGRDWGCPPAEQDFAFSQGWDIMLSPWAVDEMETADLKDKRLNERLTLILSDLGERPTASIPAACGGHTEMTAAYRFFDNDKATFQKILEPHYQRTRQRITAHDVTLLVQDTTELDLTRPGRRSTGPVRWTDLPDGRLPSSP